MEVAEAERVSLYNVVPPHKRIPWASLEIKNFLGKGGGGAVFKGVWKREYGEEEVAIKVIQGITADSIIRVRREFEFMTSINHQHVCRVYGGCIVSNSELWLVMELLEGGNLWDNLSKHFITFATILSLAIQATTGLDVLHQCNIIHRDIKSLNYLYNSNTRLLVLADFGLAKTIDQLNSKTDTLGTARWAAPEVQGKRKKWSVKADIFSLGMVFYELASGKIPFADYETATVRKKIKKGRKPVRPDDCNPVHTLIKLETPLTFAKEFWAIIEKCLNKTAKKRPSTTEVLAQLTSLQRKTTP